MDVRLVDGEPDRLPGTVLGYCSPSASRHVTILWRRVARIGRVRDFNAGTLLGYVITHEIGHLLLQRGTHKVTGLMAQQWGNRDFSLMRNYQLGFDPEDASQIRAALARRI